MTNHVHLLLTPRRPMAIASLMQSLGSSYVRYFNARYQRTGTLWEGRYHASLVATGSYLMNCYCYIELNPVRAGLTGDPGNYPWSSYRRNALGRPDRTIVEHGEYRALGAEGVERAESYRQLFAAELGPEVLEEIRLNLNQCRAFGPEAFKDEVEAALRRPVRRLRTGRPRKAPSAVKNTTLTPVSETLL
jgi:putative transposase